MYSSNDTIAAISTPIGTGGIGIVRLSGDRAFEIAEKIFSSRNRKKPTKDRTMVLGTIIDPLTAEEIDEVLLCLMKAPKTYTCEDVAEINCHGGLVAISRTFEVVIKMGARIAEPGEFTRRAFLNGRIDLSQAEAVVEFINARSEASCKIALDRMRGYLSEKIRSLLDDVTILRAELEALLDFEEEDLVTMDEKEVTAKLESLWRELALLVEKSKRARHLRDGVAAAIVGKPNVGKSSLLNALLMRDRAIVTPVPGTTRDLIEEGFSVKGLNVRLLDTAGVREPRDEIEKLGIDKTKEAIDLADFVILVVDSSAELTAEDDELLALLDLSRTIAVMNKIDLPRVVSERELKEIGAVNIASTCALTGEGVEKFIDLLYNSIVGFDVNTSDEFFICSARQTSTLEKAASVVCSALDAITKGEGTEIVAEELRIAGEALGEMIGTNVNDLLLDEIFARFCIGK